MTVAILHLGRTAAGPLLTYELAQALIADGEAVVVVYSSDAEIADNFKTLDIPTLGIRTFRSGKGALLGLFRLPQIGRRIDDFLKLHQVHTVVITMEQIWQAPLASAIAKGRCVLLFVHDATPHPGEDGVVRRALIARQRKLADGAIVLSTHVRDVLASSGQFPVDRIWQTVHPAFETVETQEARSLPRNRRPRLGFFGRMSKYKGLHLGAEAVVELRRRGREIELQVSGSGVPSDLPGANHPDTILDDRWIPQDDVQRTLGEIDILLLPYIEASQSGVLAYAMALGIPAVVTPVGGLREQAEDTGNAVVAADINAEAVADAVELLLDDPHLFAVLSSTGLQRSSSEYAWSRTSSDVISAVKQLRQTENLR